MPMNNEMMKIVQEIFLDAFHFTMSTEIGEDRKKILGFMTTYVTQMNLSILFRPDNLEKVRDSIMESAHAREFFFDLTRNFCVRLGNDRDVWNALVENLSWGVAVELLEEPENELPEVYSARMPKEDDIQAYLRRNKWLVTYVMIATYIDPETMVKP